MRIASWCLAGLVLVAAHAAWAHATPPNADGVVKPTTTGVVKPGSVVDPGMKVIRPKVPTASTPVLKPRTTTPDGSVVVPK